MLKSVFVISVVGRGLWGVTCGRGLWAWSDSPSFLSLADHMSENQSQIQMQHNISDHRALLHVSCSTTVNTAKY